jgi:hypothetical protein
MIERKWIGWVTVGSVIWIFGWIVLSVFCHYEADTCPRSFGAYQTYCSGPNECCEGPLSENGKCSQVPTTCSLPCASCWRWDRFSLTFLIIAFCPIWSFLLSLLVYVCHVLVESFRPQREPRNQLMQNLV